jgi:hypothetical protein
LFTDANTFNLFLITSYLAIVDQLKSLKERLWWQTFRHQSIFPFINKLVINSKERGAVLPDSLKEIFPLCFGINLLKGSST